MLLQVFFFAIVSTIICAADQPATNIKPVPLTASIKEADRTADGHYKRSLRPAERKPVQFPDAAYSVFRTLSLFTKLQTLDAPTSLFPPRVSADGWIDLYLPITRKTNPADHYSRADRQSLADWQANIDSVSRARDAEIAAMPPQARATAHTVFDDKLTQMRSIQIYLQNESKERAVQLAVKRESIELHLRVPPVLATLIDFDRFHQGRRRWTIQVESVLLSSPEKDCDVSPIIDRITATVVAIDPGAFSPDVSVPSLEDVVASLGNSK